jgi:hypothetical protein
MRQRARRVHCIRCTLHPLATVYMYIYIYICNNICRARRGRTAARRASLDDLIDGLLAETDAVRTAVPR